MQLQKDLDDCHTEFEITQKLTPAVDLRPPRQSTPVPRYSGKSNWEQYREIFERLCVPTVGMMSRRALQLVSHLDGDALNVALLIPESWRVPGFLIKSLSEHYKRSGVLGRIQASVSAGISASGR